MGKHTKYIIIEVPAIYINFTVAFLLVIFII